MQPKLTPTIISIIIFNFIPVWGVIYQDWSPFEMFWLFWMETLIIAVFNTIRVLFSQGKDPANPGGNMKLRLQIGSSVKYLVIRTMVFLFYALFIIVFIGLLAHEKDPVHLVRILGFQNLLFNLALFQCIAMNAYYLASHFFMNSAYLYSKTEDYPSIFDGRQIVIHVAIVLGAVGSSFLFEETGRQQYSSVWIISIFCLAKCIFELFALYNHKSNPLAISALRPNQ